MHECAHLLGVARSTVYQIAALGDLEVVHIGRRSLVTDESLRAYIDRLRGTA
jgi:excisionase family DNA binding protein